MSIYSNVTEQDLDNLRKLAQQQKEQRALKIKNRILENTHDKKLAESLSPLTKRLDLIENNKGEKIGDLIKKSESELPAIENTQSHAQTPAIENTQAQAETPAIENTQLQPGVLYEVGLENTLTNMKVKENGFFKISGDKDGQRYWNGVPIEIPGYSRLKINDKTFNITPNLQNVFTDTTGESLKKLTKTENKTYKKTFTNP